jgi:hypothetical protein
MDKETRTNGGKQRADGTDPQARDAGGESRGELIGKYLKRAKNQERVNISKSIKKCPKCEGAYNSKILKRHMNVCNQEQQQGYIYKGVSGS